MLGLKLSHVSKRGHRSLICSGWLDVPGYIRPHVTSDSISYLDIIDCISLRRSYSWLARLYGSQKYTALQLSFLPYGDRQLLKCIHLGVIKIDCKANCCWMVVRYKVEHGCPIRNHIQDQRPPRVHFTNKPTCHPVGATDRHHEGHQKVLTPSSLPVEDSGFRIQDFYQLL